MAKQMGTLLTHICVTTVVWLILGLTTYWPPYVTPIKVASFHQFYPKVHQLSFQLLCKTWPWVTTYVQYHSTTSHVETFRHFVLSSGQYLLNYYINGHIWHLQCSWKKLMVTRQYHPTKSYEDICMLKSSYGNEQIMSPDNKTIEASLFYIQCNLACYSYIECLVDAFA